MTAINDLIGIRLNVSGARGPRGLSSGPLGADSVGATELKDSPIAQEAIRTKLEVAGLDDLAAGDVPILLNEALSGDFYADQGAKIHRLADRLFVGIGVELDGNENPTTGTWALTALSGDFAYLEKHSTLLAPVPDEGGTGIVGLARTSGTNGAAGTASIASAAFAYADYIGGDEGVWCYYGTVVRASGNTGFPTGIEIDVANLDSPVILTPNQPFAPGQTVAAILATGGEYATNHTVGTASAALVIIRNDANVSPSANYDTGILFGNKALAGTDGVTGTAKGIVFGNRQYLQWYNNSGNLIAGIASVDASVASAMQALFTANGMDFTKIADGSLQFGIRPVASAVNRLTVHGSIAGQPIVVSAEGSDTDIDLFLEPKNAGRLALAYAATNAGTPGSFSANRIVPIKANGVTLYVAAATAAW